MVKIPSHGWNLSKLLDPTEIGKMFCLLGLAKALMKMIGKPLFSLLYKVIGDLIDFFYQISSYLENDVIAGDSRNQPPALPLCRRPHPVFRSRIGRLQPRGDDTGREKCASWEEGRRYEMID